MRLHLRCDDTEELEHHHRIEWWSPPSTAKRGAQSRARSLRLGLLFTKGGAEASPDDMRPWDPHCLAGSVCPKRHPAFDAVATTGTRVPWKGASLAHIGASSREAQIISRNVAPHADCLASCGQARLRAVASNEMASHFGRQVEEVTMFGRRQVGAIRMFMGWPSELHQFYSFTLSLCSNSRPRAHQPARRGYLCRGALGPHTDCLGGEIGVD